MPRTLFISIVICLPLSLFGQQKIISGYLYDKSSNESIIEGVIFSIPSKNGVTTNEYGYYSLRLDSLDSIIIVRAYGYSDTMISLPKLKRGISLNIYLKPKITSFEEIDIYSGKMKVREDEMGVMSIPMKDVKRMPNLFGEVDIIKSYQMTPGVQSGGEGSSDYYVRGGGAEQNLMLLDDVPLYNISHFGGFFSVFNSDIIKNTKLIKSGFPSQYGGRLSSVLDVRSKEGNSKELIAQGAVGLLSTRLAVEGPIVKNKASFIVSGRINPIPVFRLIGNGLNYHFNDLNAKVNWDVSDNDKLFLSFYRGRDKVKDKSGGETDNTPSLKNTLSWGNTMVAFRWNHKFGSRVFSNMTLYNTNYSYIEEFEFKEDTDTSKRNIYNELFTGVRDVGFKYHLSLFLNSKIDLNLGVNSVFHRFTPNDIYYEQTGSDIENISRSNNTKMDALENIAYSEINIDLGWLSVKGGVRYSNYILDSLTYNNFEPRLVSSFNFFESWSLKYSYTVMNQYIHLLAYSGTGLPSDYWMPTNSEVPPSKGLQHSIGLYKSLNKDKYILSLEGYLKNTNNIIQFKPGETLIGQVGSWDETVEKNGKNRSYGLEFMAQKKRGDLHGWISATYSRSLLQFDNLNEGRVFPFKYDRPLSINVVAIYDLNDNVNFSLTWQYGSGYPITLADEIYIHNGDYIFHYDDINNTRMRDYHRLDVSFNHTKEKKWGERTWTISIFNLYNRKNPYYYYYEHEYENVSDGKGGAEAVKGDLKLYQRSLFNFFPSFSYSFKF
ncbi:TonB-dependent receptor [Brumimicrobium salinarum]|nr:TonB-dependent receptor plug domain-containing protein [Brumimicrobium salinarum]